MPDLNDLDDDGLVAALRGEVARHDPVPSDAVLAAKSAIAYHDLDAQVAELIADSLEESAVAGVRHGARSRHLAFRSQSVAVEVELVMAGDSVEVSGQVAPAGDWAVAVEHPGGTIAAALSPQGDFLVARCPRGPLRFRITQRGGGVIASAWIVA